MSLLQSEGKSLVRLIYKHLVPLGRRKKLCHKSKKLAACYAKRRQFTRGPKDCVDGFGGCVGRERGQDKDQRRRQKLRKATACCLLSVPGVVSVANSGRLDQPVAKRFHHRF